MQQQCIKKLKKAEEKLEDLENSEVDNDEKKAKFEKLESRLEDLKKVKSDTLKLTAVIVLCLFLGKSLNQFLQEASQKVSERNLVF